MGTVGKMAAKTKNTQMKTEADHIPIKTNNVKVNAAIDVYCRLYYDV